MFSLAPVRVLVIRHGCAGDKRDWAGPDAERPLDPAGDRQAAALVAALTGRPVSRIVSSPARRCVDTVVPLAQARGLRVEEGPGLERTASGAELIGLVVAPESADAVLCTHGELMSHALAVFREEGVPMTADRTDDAWLLTKGSGWDLSVEDGRVTRLRHHHPAPGLTCGAHDGTARRG